MAKRLKNKQDFFQRNNNNNNDIQADEDDDERDIKIHKLSREQITAELKNGRRIKSSPTLSALFLVNEV